MLSEEFPHAGRITWRRNGVGAGGENLAVGTGVYATVHSGIWFVPGVPFRQQLPSR